MKAAACFGNVVVWNRKLLVNENVDHLTNCTCILCERKRLAVIPQPSITMLSYGTDTPQRCPYPWGSRPPSNTWFLGPTWVSNPNGISIGSAFLQGSRTWPTDWQTDKPTKRQTDQPRYSVGSNWAQSLDAMRPNNIRISIPP